ncbi:hypothetical protein Droror1_Dr00000977 [Drosera rotundifolia]
MWMNFYVPSCILKLWLPAFTPTLTLLDASARFTVILAQVDTLQKAARGLCVCMIKVNEKVPVNFSVFKDPGLEPQSSEVRKSGALSGLRLPFHLWDGCRTKTWFLVGETLDKVGYCFYTFANKTLRSSLDYSFLSIIKIPDLNKSAICYL